ncbi:hypothetical protein FA048_15300 [Pedobacter polaris]|uniref:Uncharacterized protein n=1 Tax=Pedobacter polaris TaxID=2571273 RepID=A0A4U1CJ57_9SPHI|nr:hypothetical protein [Pedobacter polaris]TKC06574.1 hypothetical protein FA048_15300 [Pedobacter polaris]
MESKITIVEFNSHGQAFSLDTKSIYNIGNSFEIIFQQDCKLYIVPQIEQYTKPAFDVNGKIIDVKIVKIDTSYMVFATKDNNNIGLQYTLNKFRTEKGISFPVDSLLNDLLIGPNNLKYFDYELGRPATVVRKNKIRIEKYPITKISPADSDTICRYYDKSLMEIDFSFSKKLDAKTNSKLYKKSFICNAIPKGVLYPDIEVPRRELYNEIIRVKEKNLDVYKEIFLKFKKDATALKIYNFTQFF